MNHRRPRQSIIALGVAVVAVLAGSAQASANGAQVTRGKLVSFNVAGYLSVNGQAQMVRTGNGKTIVTVNARGLEPGETYGSHVHNQPCSSGQAGGHYSFGHPVGGGAGPGPNSEIWPGPFTANPAGNAHGKATVEETAGPNAVSVVIHAPSGKKIACADLA